MIDYRSKYVKYKSKYLKMRFKNAANASASATEPLQHFLLGYYEMPNYGQMNCGIFISDTERDKLIKCDSTNREILPLIAKLNAEQSLFPKIYDVFDDPDSAQYYVKMQRMRGDITSLFYDYFPTKVLADMHLDSQTAASIMKIFNAKIPKTQGNLSIHVGNEITEDIGSLLAQMRDYFSDVDVNFDTYDNFMQTLLDEISAHYDNIISGIIRLKIELYKEGYEYTDNKFDNFGYIFVDRTDVQDTDINIGDDVWIRLYILDWGSGLSEADDHTINNIARELANKCAEYGTHGQYNMRRYNVSLINAPIDVEPIIKERLHVNDQLYSIITHNYFFSIPK